MDTTPVLFKFNSLYNASNEERKYWSQLRVSVWNTKFIGCLRIIVASKTLCVYASKKECIMKKYLDTWSYLMFYYHLNKIMIN